MYISWTSIIRPILIIDISLNTHVIGNALIKRKVNESDFVEFSITLSLYGVRFQYLNDSKKVVASQHKFCSSFQCKRTF